MSAAATGIDLQEVGYCYAGAGRPALDGVSLNIAPGQVYGLLGPNGAGKSTLLSLLCGLSTATTGMLSVDGRPLAGLRRAEPRAVALVPQDYAFYPTLTVRENLAFFAGILGFAGAAARARVDAGIAFAQLDDAVDRRAEQLSGGLRRRLNLAIGLLGEPRWLLLDEPTVGVDPQSRHFLLDAIAGLPAQGTSVLYTSHYMEEVQTLCRRLAILDHGKLIAEGELEALCGDAAGAQVELATDVALPSALVERWAMLSPAPREYLLKLPSTAALPGLLGEIAGVAQLRRIACGRPDLEQLFMRLTRRSLRD